MKDKNNKLAIHMLTAMVLGIAVGLVFMAIREHLGSASPAWQTINNLLFQDITASGAESAIGLFYLCGQLFIRSLQLVIVPMVFCSIVIAIGNITDAATLGRVSLKTFGLFLLTSFSALILAGVVGLLFYKAGTFNTVIEGIAASSGSTGSNPLNVILNIIPSNISSTFSVNTSVLAVVFLAVSCGLCMNKLHLGKDSAISHGCKEISDVIVVFLNFVVEKFGPVAIFMLLCRTFATYGITYLRPALSYVVITVALLLLFLFIGYPLILALLAHLNPIVFIRKIFRVVVFGFSTSSSAATLPLNIDTNVKQLGVDNQIASYVLPLGMTINMDGTAIMQVIATLFLAGVGGYSVSVGQLVIIMLLALIASAGTPAAPGAGAIILFTILSGVGFTGEAAMMGYALILAINRPIEMLVTSLNCVGDSVAAITVARSEGKLDEQVYNG
ncbi:MAG: dicarboxylate/amino acid:cation symporter [Clostridiales bacterium]|nr:dicarboxylate/amino acid:cation symporter [Clostridiales bacterium]MDY5349437.1 dicarboxylate/amino acid:cation symporter [Candidatus Ventricola sp.]MDY5514942.1 dicarboxylate/amino acid:cation symporter [Candidatus Ventricola sp.]